MLQMDETFNAQIKERFQVTVSINNYRATIYWNNYVSYFIFLQYVSALERQYLTPTYKRKFLLEH